MKVWPFEVALRRGASNHRLLRWLKTVVVSEAEKAPGKGVRWGSGRRAWANRCWSAVSDLEVASKPGSRKCSGMSLAGVRLLARWCPACRRR